MLKYDQRGRVAERTVTRKGFRQKTWIFQWNGRDQLASVRCPDNSKWVYQYDPLGRRVLKAQYWLSNHVQYGVPRQWEEANSTTYLWDGDVLVWQEEQGDNDRVKITEWFFEPESFMPLARKQGTELHYVVCDHLGTPRELFCEDGRLHWAAEYSTWGSQRRLFQAENDNHPTRGPLQGYDDHGTPVYASKTPINGNLALKPVSNPDPYLCPIRFQGQWADEETGLYYNRFRYYDSITAQYISRDPIGLVGGLRANSYTENPNIWIDPLGLNRSCSDYVKRVSRKRRGFQREMAKYDPRSDAKGGHVYYKNGVRKLTVPGGHYIEIKQFQRGIINDLSDWSNKGCAKCATPNEMKMMASGGRTAAKHIEVPPGFPSISLPGGL